MDTERAIEIIERVFISELAGTFALDQRRCLINLLRRGEKFEKMWNKFKSEYSHLKLFPSESTIGPSTMAMAMDKLEVEFFGPKCMSRWQKINNMLDKMSGVGSAIDIDELRHLLIELRDEEEKV